MQSEELRKIIKEILTSQQDQKDQKLNQDTPAVNFQTKAAKSENKPSTAGGISGYAVVKDGRVIVYGETENAAAEVVVPDNLVLLINGEPYTGRVTVTRDDRLDVVLPKPQINYGYIKVTKSDDETEAFLEITPDMVTNYRLPDKKQQKRLYLQLQVETELFCSADYDDILALLEQQGISYGIDYTQILKLLNELSRGTYRVAVGLPPGEPTDETIELLFPQTDDTDGHFENQDTKNPSTNIFSVEAGTVLAIKKPGEPGRPGISVTGRTIEPRPPQPVKMVPGMNTQMTPDGTTVVAKIAGRPSIVREGAIYVLNVSPVLVQSGNVSVTTGRIYFRGDVEVHGNVLDGAMIYALGNTEIHGFASFARINCGGNLYIDDNVFATIIHAGRTATLFLRQAKALLTDIASELDGLADLADSVLAHPEIQERQVPLGLLLLNLMEFKSPKLRTKVTQLYDMIKESEFGLPKSTTALLQELGKFLPGVKILDIEDTEILRSLATDIRFLQDCAEVTTSPSKVVIPYALNSQIESTGSVHVYGRGCYNTLVIAGGNVNVSGVFRGGRIESQGNVYAEEVGSKLCTLTKIVVPASKTVRINLCYPGVVLCIGNHVIRIEHVYQDLRIVVKQDQKVEVYGTRLDEDIPPSSEETD
ncbi:MAG: FapA family protein [Bacillota bacterium]